jgi:phage baseplate assembly protein W
MGSFSFKSVGTTVADAAAYALASTPTPLGIKTPLALGNDDLLSMNYTLVAQLTDNLKNLVLTNWGERLGFYDFGANLRPLMTDLVSLDDFDTEAINSIRNAVQRWMPYIDLQDFVSEADRNNVGNTAVIRLTITFNIPSLNVVNRKLEVTMYAI